MEISDTNLQSSMGLSGIREFITRDKKLKQNVVSIMPMGQHERRNSARGMTMLCDDDESDPFVDHCDPNSRSVVKLNVLNLSNQLYLNEGSFLDDSIIHDDDSLNKESTFDMDCHTAEPKKLQNGTSDQSDFLLRLIPRVHVLKMSDSMVNSDLAASEFDQIYSSSTQSLFNDELKYVHRYHINKCKESGSSPQIPNCFLTSDSYSDDEMLGNELVSLIGSIYDKPSDNSRTLAKKEVKPATRKALSQERKRMRQIDKQEQINQEIYPELTQESSRLILDIDKKTRRVRVEVTEKLVKELKPHQRDGIKFMYNSIIENVDRIEEPGSGCILAHEMGSGKSLQVLSLIHTILTNHHTKDHLSHILITSPASTIESWIDEFNKWIVGKGLREFYGNAVFAGYEITDPHGPFSKWYRRGGVLFIGNVILYETLFKSNSNETMKQLITRPDILIVDEAHILKRKRKHIQAIVGIKTKRKILVTGTPLYKNLADFFGLIELIKPASLGSIREFNRRFCEPFENQRDDTELMIQKANELQSLVSGSIQRYSQLAFYLPPKYEFILYIRPTPLITWMHNFYLDNVSRGYILGDYTKLIFCINHPFFQQFIRDCRDSRAKAHSSSLLKELDSYQHFHKLNSGTDNELSGKFIPMFKIIESCIAAGDKLAVICQRRETLDLIAKILEQKYQWKLNEDYGLICSHNNYSKKRFALEYIESCKLILMSSRTMGIDLIAVNRVIVFDVSWNPIEHKQSISRMYRFGQIKPVYVYHFITKDTLEEAVFHRRLAKLELINLIMDEKVDYDWLTFWNSGDYYNFRPKKVYDVLPFTVKNDRLLAEALTSNDGLVLNCIEFDSKSFSPRPNESQPNSFFHDSGLELALRSSNRWSTL